MKELIKMEIIALSDIPLFVVPELEKGSWLMGTGGLKNFPGKRISQDIKLCRVDDTGK